MNAEQKEANYNPKVWGVNRRGESVEEHDKLLCGNGHCKWLTHVQLNENGEWHRERDYYIGEVVGKYEI